MTVATTLPADAAAAPAAGCSPDGTVVTCSSATSPGRLGHRRLTVSHGSTGTKTVDERGRLAGRRRQRRQRHRRETTTVQAKPAPAGADLSVSVSAPASASSFTNVDYAMTVSNPGPATPRASRWCSTSTSPGPRSTARPAARSQMFPSTKVTCTLGALAAGASVSRMLGVTWGEAGNQTVKATVTGTGPTDPAAANNTETETTSVSD